MAKYKKIIILLLLTIFIAGCSKNEYKIDEETTLKGTVSITEITQDNETKKITILNLDNPIIIDGTKINKIELDYDKDIKDSYNINVLGKIKFNSDNPNELSYALEVIDIDDVFSFINTFGNKDFSFAIPSELMKEIIIKEIDRGFAIYSIDNQDTEVFKIYAVTKQEFNSMYDNKNSYIEKAASNREKVIIISFESNDSENTDYELTNKIVNNIKKIKDTVQIK